jgi:ABC-type lipoprotein export system ATPase subunit
MNETVEEWLIEARGLTRIYGDGASVRALDHVNLKVAEGELISVMGPSGSGKSTLLNIIGALDLPSEGDVFVGGQNLADLNDVDTFRARTVGFVFQLHNLLPTMNAQENVEIPMIGHLPVKERHARAGELLDMVGLGDRLHHLPAQLSGGERQRVAVARALANRPPLVLADEPTGNLDSKAGQDLMDLIQDLNRSQGTTFLVVTHDPAVARQTNRVVVMEDGRIAREDVVGSPLEEDLKVWRHTGLAERILLGKDGDVESLPIREDQLHALRELLQEVE